MLPRALELMRDAPDATSRGALAKVFGDHCDGVPLWEWLPWLPQLLCHLPNEEGKQVQHVLLRVARAYPQALYYPLRTYVAEGPQTGSAPEPWAPMPQPQAR